MKKLLFLLIIFCVRSTGFAQQENNLPLLFNWDDNSLPYNWIVQYNDCWGYADTAKGKEYAILGGVKGTYFFDVTNPSSTTLITYIAGADTFGLHRDYKTYKHYAYGVCDEGNSSLQVFDLQYLPDSVVKVYDSNLLCVRSHNAFIDNDKLYLAGITTLTQTYPMSVFSLADPENPALLNNLTGMPFSYVHDVCVRNDTAFASCGNQGLYIIDFRTPATPIIIQSITSYPEQGYNHSSWISENGKILVFADETHGSGLKIYDVSDIDNPVLLSIFQSNLENVSNPKSTNGSIPHNPFILGNLVFISYYHDGIQVFDISDPINPVQVAWYDTEPGNTDYSAGYAGAWGVYPFLPSMHILGSDIANGLFVLDGTQVISSVKSLSVEKNELKLYPNPASDRFSLSSPKFKNSKVDVLVIDIRGRKIMQLSQENPIDQHLNISCAELNQGIYFISVSGKDFRETLRFVKK